MNRRQFFRWPRPEYLATQKRGLGRKRIGDRANPYYNGPVSDHFDGRLFFNPDGVEPGSFADLLRWQFGSRRAKWPKDYPSPYRQAVPRTRVTDSGITVTMVGHATLLIQTQALNFLTDPVWSARASPFSFAGPKRVNRPGIDLDDLPPVDHVLLTHNHYDHLDLVTLGKIVEKHNSNIITPLGNDRIIRKSLPHARLTTGDWGDVVELDNVNVHVEPVHHWSARGLRDRRMALWAAFLLETPDHRIYHIGDTGYHSGRNYAALREKHGPVDLAILPVGAYEPRWFMKGQHQNPEEAVLGHLALGAKSSIGHHWGTFQLTNEEIDAPIVALEEARKKYGIAEDTFMAMRPGQIWQA